MGDIMWRTQSKGDSNLYISLNIYRWYYFSDSHFSETSEKQVLNTEAYILFYQRHS